MTSSGCNSVRVLSGTVDHSLVSMVTNLLIHFSYNSRGMAYHYAKKRYANYKSLANKVHLENANRDYNTTVKTFKAKYVKSMKTKIRQMRTTKPKEYWKLINSVGKKFENPQVKLDDCYAFFKELNTNKHDVNNDEEIHLNDEQ